MRNEHEVSKRGARPFDCDIGTAQFTSHQARHLELEFRQSGIRQGITWPVVLQHLDLSHAAEAAAAMNVKDSI